MKHQKLINWLSFPYSTPIILLVVCVLAYGLLIPSLGYYWDDWPYAWFNHMFGPAGYPDYVALDRPYSAWIFMALTAVFGEGPMGYHISSLLLYWVCAVLYWWLIKLVWPEHKREAFWAGMLFAVYPGFLGHPQGIIYNHHFAAMALYLFSLVGMVKVFRVVEKSSLKRTIFLWYFPSVIALLISQFTIEYFLGWEAVRLMMAWIVIRKYEVKCNGRLSKYWLFLLPYWLVSMIFLVWRVFIFQFPTYQPFYNEPDFLLREWLFSIPLQIIDAALIAWRYALPKLSRGFFSLWFWVVYILFWISSTVVICWILRLQSKNLTGDLGPRPEFDDKFGGQALVLAFVGILAAGIPFWLTGLSLDIRNQFSSRFTIAFIPWSSLLVTSILYFMLRIRFRWIRGLILALLSLLIGGSMGWHLWTANIYRHDWIEVQEYFQQLTHRMPGIEPGTSLVINDMRSINLYQDDSLTAILNWTYAPDFSGKQMPYLIQYLSVRLGNEIPALQPGLPIIDDYRSLKFLGSTDRIIVVYYQAGGCVRVLDESDLYQLPNGFPDPMVEVLPLSDLSLIQTDVSSPVTLPLNLFDLDPLDTWCMSFQKADLAAQVDDWDTVIELGDLVLGQSRMTDELTERFVYLEGYLRVGRLETALDLSQELSMRSDGRLDDEICVLWQQVESDTEINLDVGIQKFCNSN
jgi:hypothetical protein